MTISRFRLEGVPKPSKILGFIRQSEEITGNTISIIRQYMGSHNGIPEHKLQAIGLFLHPHLVLIDFRKNRRKIV